jgi:hypothetical protein
MLECRLQRWIGERSETLLRVKNAVGSNKVTMTRSAVGHGNGPGAEHVRCSAAGHAAILYGLLVALVMRDIS